MTSPEPTDHDLRLRAMDAAIAAYEAEHGEITDEEIAAARRNTRASAIQVRGAQAVPIRTDAVVSVVAMDILDDLPDESRAEVVAAIRAAWHVDAAAAEDILRASEPLWNVLEAHGGVDSWGGGEFCLVFPAALALIRQECNPT